MANTMDFDHAWTGTIRLREMEPSCVGSPNERTYWQLRAAMENLLGHHRSALESFNRVVGGRSSRQVLPAEAQSKPALAYIVSRECIEEACVVEAFHPAWEERAIPYDRVEIQTARATLYVPLDIEIVVRGYRLDGSPVFQRQRKHATSRAMRDHSGL